MQSITNAAHQQLYSEAFSPVTARSETTYPCTEAQLDRLRTPQGFDFPAPLRSHRWVGDVRGLGHHRDIREGPISTMHAAEDLKRLNRNTLSERESNAASRLQNIHSVNWGPDLVMKAFQDLDILLFSGQLNNRVRLQ